VSQTAEVESQKQLITLFTIGFTGKSAEEFFEKLRNARVRRLIDTRLNNVSQLAGFTKKRDLEYFLRTIAQIDYLHDAQLAPTKELLDGYKKKQMDWQHYERGFLDLMESRKPDQRLSPHDLDLACLLCSEPTPEHCHRRLVVEYLQVHWGNLKNWNWSIIGRGRKGNLAAYCDETIPILHSIDDRVSPEILNNLPPKEWASLQLVKPRRLRFEHDQWDQHRWRARFQDAAGHVYYLKITDASTTRRLEAGDKISDQSVLTISLTKPWAPPDGSKPELCYKLVAAVIEL
jgi:Protein of unknown function, DUF488